MAVNFNKFFNILHADAVEVYPDIRNSCLDIWQFVGKRLVVFIRYRLFFNKSSHPSNCSRFCFFSFFI